MFHGLNAHRDGDDVVLRLHKLPEVFGPRGDLLPSHLTEYRIGTGGDRLTFSEEQLSDRPMDLPGHDRRFTGRETRHGWLATTTPPDAEYGFELAGICHVDLRTGKEDLWDPGPMSARARGTSCPPATGRARAGCSRTCGTGTRTCSALGVFDAQAMADGPVARVDLPVRVPFGFHGLWVDEADL